MPREGRLFVMKKLKRAVIKEELVALTGDFKKAVVLNQMLYWSERVQDFDQFIEEEKKRSKMAMGKDEIREAEKLNEMDLKTNGWIYKTAEELSAETMMGVSKSTMGTYLNYLVKNGWLEKRKNPKWKGDNTYQYRVNLLKIQKDLKKIGYALEGYPLLQESEDHTTQFENQTTKFDNRTSEFENRTTSSKIEQPVRKSNSQFENRTTLPETTTEITPEIKTEIINNHHQEKEVVERSIYEAKYHLQKLFGLDIEADKIKKLLIACQKNKKDLLECAKNVKVVFQSSNKQIKDLIGVLMYEINQGWDKPKKVRLTKYSVLDPEQAKHFRESAQKAWEDLLTSD